MNNFPNRAKNIVTVTAAVALALTLDCMNSLGSGSSSGNPSLTGSAVMPDGTPAPNTVVQCIPQNHDPFKDPKPAGSMVDTTDETGTFAFFGVPEGSYNIQAVNNVSRDRFLRTGISLSANDSQTLTPETLKRPGSIRVMLPTGTVSVNGYVYIPGTGIILFLGDSQTSITLDSVPAGTIPAVCYAEKTTAVKKVIGSNVPVVPGGTASITMAAFRSLYLNTTASGANVGGTVTDFPVLVRLSGGTFNFSEAQKDGSDLRFTKADDTPLPYEIEQWDSAGSTAAVWIRVDTVYGNNSSQYIVMRWGGPNSPATNGSTVFDTAAGFQGVWHLGQAGNAIALDATGNGHNGTPYGMTAASSVNGIIGNCQEFDGVGGYIRMHGSAAGRLNFPQNGQYSISAWVCADSLAGWGWPQMVAGKGHEAYYLKLMNEKTWEFVEYYDKVGWQITDDKVPAQGKVWKFLTGVCSGTRQYLYIDGVLIDSTAHITAGDSSRVTTDDFSIGRYLRNVTYLYDEGFGPFDGKIDEVRVSSVACRADWIRLCYMNQKTDNKLVGF